ncbi:MAG: hypothetical protein LBQ10_03850 [Desulfovibrio sp.]|jgi:hypothetical protein|nr:hypothetical protein [Desulfovibrio sp.]
MKKIAAVSLLDGFATLVFGNLGRRDNARERLKALFDSCGNKRADAGFSIDAARLRGDGEKALQALFGEQDVKRTP